MTDAIRHGTITANTKAYGDNVIVIAKILNNSIIHRLGNDICPNVVLSKERIAHIEERHPGAYEQYGEYMSQTIENPDYIFNDVKNVRTAMFIRHVEETNLNIIVKLALKENAEQIQSSVITMYPMSDKRLRRLMKKGDLVYNSSQT